MTEKKSNDYGITVKGILSAWKETAKGGFMTISTGTETISIFKRNDSTFKLPELFTPVSCSISVGKDGFVNLVEA